MKYLLWLNQRNDMKLLYDKDIFYEKWTFEGIVGKYKENVEILSSKEYRTRSYAISHPTGNRS